MSYPQAFPGMVPYKRPAADKAGVPVYQPATTYQQLMQLQQPFVPVSCEYTAPPSSAPPTATVAVAPANVSAPLPAQQPPLQPPAPTSPPSPGLPPPQSALLESSGPDPAQVAKEVAQKNYVAALAFAAQQSAMAHAYTQQALKARAAAGAAGLMRAPQYMMRPSWPPQAMAMPYYQQPYMYAMPPPTQPSAAAVAAAHAAHNPYKKMKTT